MKKSLSKGLVFWCASFLIALGSVSGCNKQNETPKPAPAPKAQPKPKPEAKVNVAVQGRVTTAKIGSSTGSLRLKGKKDPFKPLITPPDAAAAKTPSPNKAKAVDVLPMQSHEVSQFAVTGIIVGLKDNKALVVDPSGKGYVVKQGMLIGSNDGRITKITASSVEVTEQYLDGKKQLKFRKIVLPLAKKSKEISR